MVLVLCTYPILPWVQCSGDTIIGFDGNLIRTAASGLRWREGVDYIIRCVASKTDAFRLLRGCGREDHCDAVFGDIAPDTSRTYLNNVTYSSPYQCTSLAAMTTSESDTNIWSIFTPFSWQLWVLLISLPFIYGLMMTCLDFFIHRVFRDTKHSLCKPSTLPEFVFDHASMMLGQGDRHEILRSHRRMYKERFLCLVRLTIQIMFLTFAFMCFVISSTYTAELTTILLKKTPRLKYTSFERLLLEGTTLVPRDRLRYFRSRWSVNPTSYVYENTDSYLNAMAFLRNETVDGIIGNRATLQWIQEMNTDCSVSIVPSSDIAYYGPVIAWSPCVSQVVINDMNARIVDMEMDGTIEQIAESSLRGLSISGNILERQCVTRTSTIGIRNVGGVFVIMACGTAVPICFIVSKYILDLIKHILTRYQGALFGIGMKNTKSVKSMDSYEQDSDSVSA